MQARRIAFITFNTMNYSVSAQSVSGPDAAYADCTLCPRACHANRFERSGFCGAGTMPKLARAALHLWEEPCISGKQGSGAVFFSHCTLRCVFCQNHEISAGGFGREISDAELGDIFLRLQDEGAANINLVTASHFLPSCIAALDRVRHRLHIPVVYNCGGYESVDALRMLDGYVDIYLPDMKYADDTLALSLSGAPHYRETAEAALKEMLRQTGAPVFENSDNPEIADGRGNAGAKENLDGPGAPILMKKGLIVRHMVLPGHRKDSIAVLRLLANLLPADRFMISLLRQYTPFYRVRTEPEFKSLNRRLTSFEYDSVVQEALRLGLQGFMQEKDSASEEYTPSFRLEGVP